MNQATVNTVLIPADAHQEIMVAFPVEDELTLNFAVGVRVSRILSDYSFDNRAIRLYSGIH